MVGRIGIPRVRFITSHPINLDDEIIEAIADTPSVCRFIHLPVQSGSNRVLARMLRGYTREEYLRCPRKVLIDLSHGMMECMRGAPYGAEAYRELLSDATLVE